MLGFSRFPEQPAASVSDAGGKVAVREFRARAGGSPARHPGQTDAEGARGCCRPRGTDEPAHRDRIVQSSHRVPREKVYRLPSLLCFFYFFVISIN